MMIVDTHVHLYPDHDIGVVLRLCAERLHGLVPDAVPVACLTERHDCRMFRQLCDPSAGEWAHVLGVEVLAGGGCVRVRFGGGVPPLFVLPGRQIATHERIELHCLGKDAVIADGASAVETVGRIREIDGLVVLPWGVGKWLFRRQRVVEDLCNRFGPEVLLLGDSAMRPVFWPAPQVMRATSGYSHRVLAGSDPLPHEGKGCWIGCYATLVDAPFDPSAPAQSCIMGLRQGKIALLGQRPGPWGFARRMLG